MGNPFADSLDALSPRAEEESQIPLAQLRDCRDLLLAIGDLAFSGTTTEREWRRASESARDRRDKEPPT